MYIFTSGKVLMAPVKVIDDSTCKTLGGGERALCIFSFGFFFFFARKENIL